MAKQQFCKEELMLVVCYAKCGTCRKALKWMKDNGIEADVRDIKEDNPSAEELKEWTAKSGLPLRKHFNTSGKLYKEMHLKDRLKDMSDEEVIALLASDGMLVKRPVLVKGDTVLVGFNEEAWKAALL